jgi:hypothetical protein
MQTLFYGFGIYWFMEYYELTHKWWAWVIAVLVVLYGPPRITYSSKSNQTNKKINNATKAQRQKEILDGFHAKKNEYIPGITNK